MTYVYGTSYKDSSVPTKDWFNYTVTENASQYIIGLTAGVYHTPSDHLAHSISSKTVYLTGTGQTTQTGTLSSIVISDGTARRRTAITSVAWTYTKGTSSATKTITAYSNGHSSTKASKTFTVPALQSYTVAYNANGGSGAPSSQTKYYGKTLTLTSSKPTRSGYTFKGWATTSARANAGTIDYVSGYSYTDNAALTLYAVWDLNYIKPIIKNVSVERCESNGALYDEGKYAKVVFDWSIDVVKYPSNTVNSLTVQVGSSSKSYSTSSDSGSISDVIGNGTYDTDTTYSVTITLSDTSGETVNYSTWTGTLGLAVFPLDISADGNSVGICRPAPDNTHGVFVGDDLEVKGNITANGHDTPIGTVIQKGLTVTKNVPTSTYTGLCSVTLGAGTWLLSCGLRFPSNATGRRMGNVIDTENGAAYQVSYPPVSGAPTQIRFTHIYSPTTETTYWLNAWQDSGTTLVMPATGDDYGSFIQAVRIA